MIFITAMYTEDISSGLFKVIQTKNVSIQIYLKNLRFFMFKNLSKFNFFRTFYLITTGDQHVMT